MTTDIDAVVRGDAVELGSLVATLHKYRILPRIPDALEFARVNLVLLLRHHPTGVDLDLSFAWTQFEHEALTACQKVSYGGIKVPIARAEDLIIYKALAGRPRDIEDAETLLLLYRDLDLVRVRGRVHELAMLAGEPALERGLEALIAKTKAVGQSPTRRTRRSRAGRPATIGRVRKQRPP